MSISVQGGSVLDQLLSSRYSSRGKDVFISKNAFYYSYKEKKEETR